MRKRILIALAAALVVASIGLHFLLKQRLNAFVQHVAVPSARERLRAEVSAGDAGVSLLAGAAVLADLHVGNPPGFAEPEALSVGQTRVGFSRRSLLRGQVRIASLALRDAHVAIIRDAAGRINLRELTAPKAAAAVIVAPAEQAPTATAPAETAARPARPPVQPIPEHIRVSGVATYIDHSSNAPVHVDFAVVIAADGLSSCGDAAAPWGAFTIRGHLASAPDTMQTELRGRVAPLADPARPSFDLDGTITSIDAASIPSLTAKTGITCDPFTMDVKAICRDGVFDEAQSHLTLHLNNVRVPLGKDQGLTVTVSSVTVPIPLRGTFQNPDAPWRTAVPTALLQSAGNNLVSIAPMGGKSNDVSNVLKALGVRWPKTKSQ